MGWLTNNKDGFRAFRGNSTRSSWPNQWQTLSWLASEATAAEEETLAWDRLHKRTDVIREPFKWTSRFLFLNSISRTIRLCKALLQLVKLIGFEAIVFNSGARVWACVCIEKKFSFQISFILSWCSIYSPIINESDRLVGPRETIRNRACFFEACSVLLMNEFSLVASAIDECLVLIQSISHYQYRHHSASVSA